MAKELMVYGKKRIEKGTDGTSQVRYDCFFEHNGVKVQLVPSSESQWQLFDLLFNEGPYALIQEAKELTDPETGEVIPYDAYSIMIEDVSFNLKVREKSAKGLFAFLIRKALAE